jgi:hypothetical protein
MTNLIFKRQLGFSNVVFEGFRIYLLKFREIFLITLVAIIPAIFLFGLRLDMQSRATSITGGTLFLFIIPKFSLNIFQTHYMLSRDTHQNIFCLVFSSLAKLRL